MTNEDAIKWLENLRQDIGQLRHESLWHYEQAIVEIMGLLEEQEMKWIPVSERLPDEYTNVLVMSKRFEEPKIDQVWIIRGEKIWTLDYVTHWMPLPKPPQKDGDGE